MSDSFQSLSQELNRLIIGQQALVERLQIALLADGHLLVEGAPGLAKTRAVKALAGLLDASFQRIQFTPDLLPADIIGAEIYQQETRSLTFQPGPIFHEIILADEINRAPAKVQSALLEAMGERQVSVSGNTLALPDLFMVMATQNPIEQEGTYPLPEAQLDRFLMQVRVDYPDADSENTILELTRAERQRKEESIQVLLNKEQVQKARDEILALHMSPPVQEYLVQLVLSTRQAERYDEAMNGVIEHGASPRATIALDLCARSRAWLQGRDFVTPDDVQELAADCLRHRIVLSLSAQARDITADQTIERLLDLVPVT
ncbi:MAG: AAA family ATPase [Gammaproteobacteria bacterium]|nr:AAA family ATPase [Gammaproteobacteria bacterium]